jgi:hypothetical protein
MKKPARRGERVSRQDIEEKIASGVGSASPTPSLCFGGRQGRRDWRDVEAPFPFTLTEWVQLGTNLRRERSLSRSRVRFTRTVVMA